jgi:hypothetical protein
LKDAAVVLDVEVLRRAGSSRADFH